ncbi:MAG TPA: DUF1295 domain-containing protein [Steroidobacteraceae bacterium]|nr:DUF1295 domain-containing protein [Steroidobacteraceae bacterium]
MMAQLSWVVAVMAVVMTAGWCFQRAVHNAGWSDVFWTYGTGATCAAVALMPFGAHAAPTWRQGVVATLVAIWALRLGSYVALRVARGREDVRYAGLRQSWGPAFQRKLFALLIVQAPATMLLSISVLLAARNPEPRLRLVDVLGVLVLLVAIGGEAMADRQMQQFKQRQRDPGVVCTSGLWAWSRHPNYFFEFLGWIAYPLLAVRPAAPWSWAAWIAPLVMFGLLRFLTGVPALEAAMLRSKGEAYARYQAHVNTFFPLPSLRSEG